MKIPIHVRPAGLLLLCMAPLWVGCEETAKKKSMSDVRGVPVVKATNTPTQVPVTSAPAIAVPPPVPPTDGAAVAPPTPTLTPAPASAVPVVQSTNVVDGPRVAVIPSTLSPRVAEVARMIQSGVDEGVLQAFVDSSKEPYDMSVDEVVYLTDLGVSPELLQKLVRGRTPRAEGGPVVPPPTLSYSTNPAPATPGVNSVVVLSNTTPGAVVAPQPGAPQVVVQPQPEPQPQTVVVQPVYAAPQVTYTYFQDALAPYGTWVSVPEYGLCWRPTVASLSVGWRPYSDRGRWIYTDAGWYWQSDYSWGYIPFHYGRWWRSPGWGWVWVPDTTWGPSWVSWRYTSDYCGWAPLPPGAHYRSGVGFYFHGSRVGVGFSFGLSSDCYSFVPTHRFYDRHLSTHVRPGNRMGRAFDDSKVVNNYIVGNNNTVIINQGVDPQMISKATRTDIRKVQLRDVPQGGVQNDRPDRLDREGRTLAVYRPNLPVNAPTASPAPMRGRSEPGKNSIVPTPIGITRDPAEVGRVGNVGPTPSAAPAITPTPSAGRPVTPTTGSRSGQVATPSPAAPAVSVPNAPADAGGGKRLDTRGGSPVAVQPQPTPSPAFPAPSINPVPSARTTVPSRTPAPGPSVAPNPAVGRGVPSGVGQTVAPVPSSTPVTPYTPQPAPVGRQDIRKFESPQPSPQKAPEPTVAVPSPVTREPVAAPQGPVVVRRDGSVQTFPQSNPQSPVTGRGSYQPPQAPQAAPVTPSFGNSASTRQAPSSVAPNTAAPVPRVESRSAPVYQAPTVRQTPAYTPPQQPAYTPPPSPRFQPVQPAPAYTPPPSPRFQSPQSQAPSRGPEVSVPRSAPPAVAAPPAAAPQRSEPRAVPGRRDP